MERPAGRAARGVLLLLLPIVLLGCGDEETSSVDVPAWARVGPRQIAEAEERGVPVAFENDLGMRFVLIPSGAFPMGSPDDEAERDDDEVRHRVWITEPCYLSIHEVTNGQYRAWRPDHHSGVVETPTIEGGIGTSLDDDQQPVVQVSWDDASEFTAWLGEQDGRSYRLPTEAEWEHACRAETTTPFWWGETASTDRACYDGDYAYDGGPLGEHRRGTLPVGQFDPNPWGLYDVHGNVAEWCADWYAPYGKESVVDPRGPRQGFAPSVTTYVRYGEDVMKAVSPARVQRGGGWSHLPRFCRSAARLRSVPRDRQDNLGFRVVAALPPVGDA